MLVNVMLFIVLIGCLLLIGNHYLSDHLMINELKMDLETEIYVIDLEIKQEVEMRRLINL